MKKVFISLMLLFASTLVFAFEFSLGARAGVDLNIYEFRESDFNADMKMAAGVGINGFANFSLPIKGLYIQPEVGFHYHNATAQFNDRDVDFHFMTIDLPVLVYYKFDLNKRFFIMPGIGPKPSFTIGKIDGDWDFDLLSPFNMGLEIDAVFGINAGSGAVLISVRFSNDFSLMRVDNDDETKIGSDRSLNVSAGYQFKIK